jgi:hypothetical protein
MGIMNFFSGLRKIKVLKKEQKPKEPYEAFEVAHSGKGTYKSYYKKLLKYSLIMLIIGKRGSGKTALGMKFLELFGKESRKKCYILGYKDTKLPRWLRKVDKIENIPNDSVALIDEGAVAFFSRESMKDANKALSKIMAIARHKNLTLMLITQNSAMIDLNVLRLADTLLLKEPSLLQSRFERKVLRDMYDKVVPVFKNYEEKKDKFYVWDDEFEGVLSFKLPEFWSESVSKSFKN